MASLVLSGDTSGSITVSAPAIAGSNTLTLPAVTGGVAVTTGDVIGYYTGLGGTVTQATSRTTSVTLNKPTGAITLFTAAGSATAAQFTVNNSYVSATDVVVLSYKGSSNVYQFVVSSVANGSFNITFWSYSGVASDAPVVNFAIINGVTS